jgi:short-chain fatty acids transporter
MAKEKDKPAEQSKGKALERFGLRLAEWTEKWFPDAWVFALVGIVVVFCFGLLIGESPAKLVVEGGKSFWALIPFTMQMALIIIGGYVVATTPVVYAIIQKVAGITTKPRVAIAWVAFFSMATSLISWGLSLIFSGLLVREMSRRIKGLDYRAAGAAGYLGLGAVWALGFSSSAALMMATRGAIPPSLPDTLGCLKSRIKGLLPKSKQQGM